MSTDLTANNPRRREDSEPWWRHGMVWLVIGGPASVVVASLITAVVAIRGQDPVLNKDDDTAGVVIRAGDKLTPMTPAMTARNHASTKGQH